MDEQPAVLPAIFLTVRRKLMGKILDGKALANLLGENLKKG